MARGEATQEFRSPKRALARFFRLSRDKWKEKYMDLKKANKRLKVNVADLNKSRARWREEAESRKAELQRMIEEVEQLRAQLQVEEPLNPSLKKMASRRG